MSDSDKDPAASRGGDGVSGHGGGQSRSSGRVARVVGLLVLVVAGAGAVVYGVAAGDRPAPSSDPPTVSTPALPSPYSSPPDGGTVKVVDAGVARTFERDGDAITSYGVVVENTSALVAAGVGLKIRILDQSGRMIKDAATRGDEGTDDRRISSLRPGARDGISGIVVIDKGNAARVEVDVEVTAWWTLGEYPETLPPRVEISGITVERKGHGNATVTFTADASDLDGEYFCVELIIRDDNGSIVGGAGSERAIPDRFPEGESEARIETYGSMPPKVSGERYEAYVTPGCVR